MKAAVVDEWGAVPRYTDFPDPDPRNGDVVATVEAAALTNLTRGIVSGTHYASKDLQLPAVPGFDGVARLDDGRRVYTSAVARYGTMADRTLVNPNAVVEVPEGVDSVTAAAVPNPGISAWTSLEYAAAVKPGDHVLVLGATGVTGSVAVQLAKSEFGAGRVVAVGRDVARLQWLRTVGADATITLGDDDFTATLGAMHAEKPFDAVLDYLWGKPAETVLETLGSSQAEAYHLTRYIEIGSMAGTNITLPSSLLRATAIQLSGVGLGNMPPDVMARVRAEALPRLFDMAAAGKLQLRTATRPLAEVEQAWTAGEKSGTRLVLVP
ncbi:alcohol dehydrogenase [Mycolicibacterium agri]|uniref:Alcohol dehydrogenase n=1 Tax=Mycolicibacterium agri TaxID=36811 RepID=A0A2A7MW36_MYCAG|nr:zinc-binding dehydrogenase [Mycolicibacterium agri]PEG35906.1 alcohol dehydrogenase [Mycolicibacterium agri]GFG54256.1 putative zinc-binding alcohol dehydrogenase [Mycolicibacterium agri]